ncbi:hypothetical protein ACLOJK_021022 [Asimina triloba]
MNLYYNIVVAFGSASEFVLATRARPSEVRRIFTMGLPFSSHHGGQILFGPDDGYLYFMMGDGGSDGDPYNFAQNEKSLLGKIMRLDIDNIPSEKHEAYEEVDLITKGGNYGWRVYEGPYLYTPLQTPGGNTTPSSINPIFPVMGYNHSINGSSSITGGYMYRSTTDPCMFGRYLYADLYEAGIWAGIESPENSGNFSTSSLNFSCAGDSPIPCNSIPGTSVPSLGYIFSFGEDNKKDVYILASSGVYRVVRPSRCSYTCSKENTTIPAGRIPSLNSPPSTPPPPPSPPSASSLDKKKWVALVLSSLLLVLSY